MVVPTRGAVPCFNGASKKPFFITLGQYNSLRYPHMMMSPAAYQKYGLWTALPALTSGCNQMIFSRCFRKLMNTSKTKMGSTMYLHLSSSLAASNSSHLPVSCTLGGAHENVLFGVVKHRDPPGLHFPVLGFRFRRSKPPPSLLAMLFCHSIFPVTTTL